MQLIRAGFAVISAGMIPTTEYFNAMWQYVMWADRAQLAAADSVNDDAYFAPRGFSFGSIHATLLHLVSAEQAWLDRFENRTVVWLANEPRLAGRPTIKPQFAQTHEAFTRFLIRQSTQTLEAALTYRNLKGEQYTQPLGKLLIHVINHASHHRGQLNSMLKLAGASPPTVDYAYYINHR